MATRTIGDIQKSNGNALTGDSITVTNADTRQSGQSLEKNELNELGQKIFLDRYAVKDAKKRTLAVGDLVIVIVDDKSGQREIGTVVAFDPTASGGAGKVSVELKDGMVVERLTEHVSKPIETSPEQMMERVARGIAAIEGEKADEWYEKFRWLLNGWKFVPAGRILTAAGTDQQLTFYNCYVVPSPKDSRIGIVDTLSQMMEIMSRGGGVGINISSLRPRHSYVKGVNGRSSGSVSWGALYSFVTGLIEQGGCLTPETLVFTEDGLLRLDEIVRHRQKGWREHEMAIMTDEGERLSQQVYNNGVAEVLRVKTNVGIEITGTANHKVKVMTDSGTAWRQLDELQRGDAILVKLGQHTGKLRSLQKPESKHHNQDLVDLPTVLDEDLAFFLGYFAGDGFMTSRNGDWRLGVAVSHTSYLMAEMPRLIQRLFPGVNLRVQQKENDASLIYLISNRLIKEFLRLNGFDKSKSTEARVPRLIRQSPPSVVGAYLRGLFEADGGISHGYPTLISASKQLIDEVATLLIGLGCPVKIELQPMGENHFGNHPLWRLRIHSFKGLENWKTKIGCDDSSRFAACATFTPDLTREVSYRLPNAAYWVEPVLTATALPQIDHRATGQRISSTDMALRRKLLRYQRVERHFTLSAYTTLSRAHMAFAENAPDLNDTWFVYVENVEKAGTSPTLDIEVDDNHTYLANGLVTHNSRRGALMLILNCWHPDVLEFINAKRDMGKINNANVSVGITDKFMEAVRSDADWDLVFPDSSTPDFERLWDGNLDKWINAGHPVITYKTVKARDVWNAIIESAWASAEPGVFFIDRANKDSNSWYYDAGYLACTNPCVTGDTLVSTPTGWKRVDEIQEGERIATILGQGEVETVETHTQVPVFKVTLSDGAVIRATAAHRFHAIPASERPSDKAANKHFSTPRLDELQVGDYIRIAPALMPDRDVPGRPAMWMDREYGFAIGILLGDGCYTENNLSRNTVTISCDARETEWTAIVASLMTRAGASIVSRYQNRDSKGRITNSLSLSSQGRHGLAEFIGNTLLSPVKSGEKDIPLDYINTNKDFLAGLLDGLWSTDGNVSLKSTHPLLRFKMSSEKLAQSVRRILLMFGIHGRIVSGFRKQHEINGRRIKTSNPYYELIISGAGVKAFAEQIGVSHPDKAEKLKQAQLEFALTGNTWLATIKSIEPDGEERVYDLYEPVSDTWITEGIVNRGCGEQPIPGWAVCNLGAINLSKFVQDGEVTWDELGKAVRYSVRFLDNVIDATPYFFEENYRQQKNERRVGLNTMGLAEMMIRLGIRYGSEESTRFIDRLYRFISSNAYQASAEIAAEKGAFPEFDAEKFLQSGYMQRMPEDVRQTVREKGIRNVTLLTQAPNGTIGTMVGTSTGIEPFYFWSYLRKSRLGQHEERVKVLEEWQQAHPGEPLPDYFVTAMDLTPKEHVQVQAAIQRWVDSAISKTCNLPSSYSVEQTRELYELMYKLGCKGGTIYRDGSRDVQVLNLKEEDKKVSEQTENVETPAPSTVQEQTGTTEAQPVTAVQPALFTQLDGGTKPKIRPRPYKRRGYTVSKNTPSGTAHITMNEDEEGQPFEVFVEIGKAGSDIKAMAEAMGRLMSLLLRIESPISPTERVQEIVKQITGIGGARSYGFGKRRVLSLPDAVGQALAENYLGVTSGTEQDNQGSEMGVSEALALLEEGGNAEAAQAIANSEIAKKLLTKAASGAAADICPNCGDSAFIRVEGCQTCYACGYSEC